MARPQVPVGEKSFKQSITIKPDVMPVLQRYCQKEDRSMSWIIDKALRQYLSEHGEEI